MSGQCLTASRQSLKQGIAQRKTVEKALKTSRKHYEMLLEESLAQQNQLRRLTHQVLTALEAERKRISHDLQDEVVQTLLGINVRLLTLKKTTHGNTASVKKEIDNTQRLVQESVRSINEFARELDLRQQA